MNWYTWLLIVAAFVVGMGVGAAILGRTLLRAMLKGMGWCLLFAIIAAPALAQTTAERKSNINTFVSGASDALTLQIEDALVPLGYKKLTPPVDPPPPVEVTYGPRFTPGQKDYYTTDGVNRVTIPLSAVSIFPGDNWQTKVNAGTTGTVFRVKAGVHRSVVITPKNGQQFWGEPGAIVDGNQINSRFLQGSATNVLVKNLTVTNYRNPLQDAMLGNSSMKTLMIEDCTVSKSYGFGVRVGKHMKRSVVFDCQQGGLSSYYTTGAITEDCEFYNDNPQGAINRGTTAKHWNCTGAIVRYCHFHDMRFGAGLWFDANNLNCEVHNCLFEKTGAHGLYYEISYGLRAHDNFIRTSNGLGDDYPGIRLQNSRGCELWNNRIEDCYAGIQLASSERSNPAEQKYGDWITRDNFSHDNTISRCKYLSQNISWGDDFNPLAASAANRFDRNKYKTGAFYWGGNKTWQQWNALGNDTQGSYSP